MIKTDDHFFNTEVYFHTILQTTRDGFWLLDTGGKIVDVNDAYCKMSGYTRSELLGFHIEDLEASENAHTTAEHIQFVMQHGSDIFTSKHRRKDGSIFPVEISTTYTTLKGGSFICFCRDNSEHIRIESELKKNEAALEKAQQVAHVGNWHWDIKTNQVTWSKEMYRIFGIDPDHFNGSLSEIITSAIHPDDREKVNQANAQVIQEGVSLPLEYRIVRPDGSIGYVWAEAGELTVDETGNPAVLSGIVLDTTKYKESEIALLHYNEMFSQFIHNSPVFVFIKQVSPTQSKMIMASENYVDVIGIPGNQLTGKSMEDFYPPEFAKKITADDWKVVSSGEIYQGEEHLKGRIYSTIKFPIHQGDKVLLAGYAVDITEQKEIEEALRSSKEHYFLIDEASQDSIYSYDRQGRFTHANTHLCNTLGLTTEEIVGKTHEELGIPQKLCDEWAILHQKVYDTNATVIAETTGPLPDGSIHFYEVVLNPIHDAQGTIIGIAGTTRDIHERKMAEAKIKEQLNELNRWHKITMGREERILELKQEVNELLSKLGKHPKYDSVEEG